jgi:hypothetical protein
MYLNCIVLKTGDPNRMAIDSDLLGEGVDFVKENIGIDKIFNLLAPYVQKVHLDEIICKCLRYNPGTSFLDVIGPNDIAYVIALIKNSRDMWDQNMKMKELGTKAIGNQDKKFQPLFTGESGQKRT